MLNELRLKYNSDKGTIEDILNIISNEVDEAICGDDNKNFRELVQDYRTLRSLHGLG